MLSSMPLEEIYVPVPLESIDVLLQTYIVHFSINRDLFQCDGIDSMKATRIFLFF